MTCIVRPWLVTVGSFRGQVYVARSRGKALAKAWRDYQVLGPTSFGDFLRIATVERSHMVGFGRRIRVAGLPAYRVGERGQYVAFVRPDSDEVLLAHPLDVDVEKAAA